MIAPGIDRRLLGEDWVHDRERKGWTYGHAFVRCVVERVSGLHVVGSDIKAFNAVERSWIRCGAHVTFVNLEPTGNRVEGPAGNGRELSAERVDARARRQCTLRRIPA